MARPDAGYALIMLAAIAAAVVVQKVSSNRLPLPGRQRLALGLGAFCGAMIGAKLPFLLADWPGLLSGRAWLDNGKTILFGMAGGYLGVEIVKAVLGIRMKTGDSFAAPVAAAIGIGRLACYHSGCCYGVATQLPWGVDFGDGVCRHPTQLYEAGFHLAAAATLVTLARCGALRGQLIKLYFIAYCVFRFATEFIRPEPRLWPGLTLYQWGALCLIGVFAGLWIHDARTIAAASPEP
ncbi:MAG: prolipoprotein diacylglyceryl transferase [Planctomycetaceae bacterium]